MKVLAFSLVFSVLFSSFILADDDKQKLEKLLEIIDRAKTLINKKINKKEREITRLRKESRTDFQSGRGEKGNQKLKKIGQVTREVSALNTEYKHLVHYEAFLRTLDSYRGGDLTVQRGGLQVVLSDLSEQEARLAGELRNFYREDTIPVIAQLEGVHRQLAVARGKLTALEKLRKGPVDIFKEVDITVSYLRKSGAHPIFIDLLDQSPDWNRTKQSLKDRALVVPKTTVEADALIRRAEQQIRDSAKEAALSRNPQQMNEVVRNMDLLDTIKKNRQTLPEAGWLEQWGRTLAEFGKLAGKGRGR